MENHFFIVITTCVLGGIVYYCFRYRLRKKRRVAHLIHNASFYDFRFEGDSDATPGDTFAPLRLFSLRVPGKMKNVLTRTVPPMWVFDYEYSIQWDQDVGQTVAIIEMRKTKWPPTVIESGKRERFTVAAMRLFTQKLANWQFRYREVDLSTYPAFGKRYRAFCQGDPDNVKGFLTQPFRDFLVQNPGWNVETMGQWLLIYRQGQYLRPEEFGSFIETVLAIYQLIEND